MAKLLWSFLASRGLSTGKIRRDSETEKTTKFILQSRE